MNGLLIDELRQVSGLAIDPNSYSMTQCCFCGLFSPLLQRAEGPVAMPIAGLIAMLIIALAVMLAVAFMFVVASHFVEIYCDDEFIATTSRGHYT